MGLIRAGVGAMGGVLADTWRDYFYCDSLDANTLVAKGRKRVSSQGRSSNTRGEDLDHVHSPHHHLDHQHRHGGDDA
jgi:hypothetical protein